MEGLWKVDTVVLLYLIAQRLHRPSEDIMISDASRRMRRGEIWLVQGNLSCSLSYHGGEQRTCVRCALICAEEGVIKH